MFHPRLEEALSVKNDMEGEKGNKMKFKYPEVSSDASGPNGI